MEEINRFVILARSGKTAKGGNLLHLPSPPFKEPTQHARINAVRSTWFRAITMRLLAPDLQYVTVTVVMI